MLGADERRLLHRMSVFAGGFDLHAINGVYAEERQSSAQVADLTARLVEKSLFMKLGDSGRHQLLETIRQYSIERLGADGVLDTIRDRHARYYLGAALPECAGMTTGPERPRVEAIGRIEDNVRVALAQLIDTDPESALGLAAGMTNFWWVQGKLREGIGWLVKARETAPNAPVELRATASFCEGFLFAHDTDDWFAAAKRLDVGIELLSSTTDSSPMLGMMHCLRGECDVLNGDAASAVKRTEIGLAMLADHPHSWGRAFCLWNAAYAKLAVGDEDASLAHFAECINVSTRFGFGIADMCACNIVAEIWERRGDLKKSRFYWERALQLRQDIGASRMSHVHGTLPTSMLAVARLSVKQGDVTLASKLLREALPLAEQMRDEATAQKISELLRETSRVEPYQSATLRPEAGVWLVAFNGKTVHVPELKGLWHLRELVSRPREPLTALSLISGDSEEPLLVGDTGPMLDRDALPRNERLCFGCSQSRCQPEEKESSCPI